MFIHQNALRLPVYFFSSVVGLLAIFRIYEKLPDLLARFLVVFFILLSTYSIFRIVYYGKLATMVMNVHPYAFSKPLPESRIPTRLWRLRYSAVSTLKKESKIFKLLDKITGSSPPRKACIWFCIGTLLMLTYEIGREIGIIVGIIGAINYFLGFLENFGVNIIIVKVMIVVIVLLIVVALLLNK